MAEFKKIAVRKNSFIAGYTREKYIASIHLYLRVTFQRDLCPENKMQRFDVVSRRSSLEEAENFLNCEVIPHMGHNQIPMRNPLLYHFCSVLS
jgi:hypothetical protein